ncbi:MAG: FHA domain-containing protein [Akkermansiaceae bacterium]|nr:FHA domain-containing protein [Akkermansiaceae bacterium]MCP5551140.1 FHA domain-containing protein [Akkermansiaceae bacterium]
MIVEGPGKGHSLTLTYGMNSIGRTEDNRVPLPFGDSEVSRHKHAVLSYDPRGRKFYIQAGGDGPNMAYLDDAPLLAPREILGGEKIRLGQTVLQFVPFCGESFDWD